MKLWMGSWRALGGLLKVRSRGAEIFGVATCDDDHRYEKLSIAETPDSDRVAGKGPRSRLEAASDTPRII
jgi:hypothetical protein